MDLDFGIVLDGKKSYNRRNMVYYNRITMTLDHIGVGSEVLERSHSKIWSGKPMSYTLTSLKLRSPGSSVD